ncbi:MAG: hypothetical protein AAFR75_08210, partial [Pseudomonadota bacterium]
FRRFTVEPKASSQRKVADTDADRDNLAARVAAALDALPEEAVQAPAKPDLVDQSPSALTAKSSDRSSFSPGGEASARPMSSGVATPFQDVVDQQVSEFNARSMNRAPVASGPYW